MIFSVDFVAGLALQFGPAETFGLLVFGLSTICGLSSGSIVKGLIGAAIGLMVMTIGVGAIPGTGGPIAAFLAYAHAQKTSRTPEKFGRGVMQGVVAPETANNAVTGGNDPLAVTWHSR